MCKGSGQTGVSNQSSTVSIPPEILARYNQVFERGQAAADQPFQTYGGQFVAPVNATQQQAISNIGSLWNSTAPWIQQAGHVLNTGAAGSRRRGHLPHLDRGQSASPSVISGAA